MYPQSTVKAKTGRHFELESHLISKYLTPFDFKSRVCAVQQNLGIILKLKNKLCMEWTPCYCLIERKPHTVRISIYSNRIVLTNIHLFWQDILEKYPFILTGYSRQISTFSDRKFLTNIHLFWQDILDTYPSILTGYSCHISIYPDRIFLTHIHLFWQDILDTHHEAIQSLKKHSVQYLDKSVKKDKAGGPSHFCEKINQNLYFVQNHSSSSLVQ